VSEFLARWSSREITELMAYTIRLNDEEKAAAGESEKPEPRVQTADEQLAFMDSWN
jgi:hypothetical protein